MGHSTGGWYKRTSPLPPGRPGQTSSLAVGHLELSEAIASRRTVYDLTASSPIPDSRIVELVHHVARHVPSPFNSQSARFLVLMQAEHRRLWDNARTVMAQVLPEGVFTTYFAPMIAKYREG